MLAFLLDNLFWAVLALLSATGLVWTFVRAGQASLTAQAAVLLVSRTNGLFIDVRSAAEFADGHIANAHNIPSSEFDKRLEALSKHKKKPIVVVCQNGMRGRAALQQLEKAGFEGARILTGGIAAWREAQLPLTAKPTKGKI